ncbi:MAG TPA: hypothetical protein VMF61_01655 [Candidatus Acidoferrales bacterium]|nr:hypothetical protein [Candidatus Acidoferrales bacterium]
MRSSVAPAAAALLLLLAAIGTPPAPAALPALSAAPQPGAVVQVESAGRWRAVVSKKFLGEGAGNQRFYQWYLSVYYDAGGIYGLKYRSPAGGGPLSKVERAAGGARMWFPTASAQIVGFAHLMPSGMQLVVQSHEMSADCGDAVVSVLALHPNESVEPAASVRNGCELSATIDRGMGAGRDTLTLDGPYYAPNAAMCCPTKAKAAATLSYRGGAWTLSPANYSLYPGRFPPQ